MGIKIEEGGNTLFGTGDIVFRAAFTEKMKLSKQGWQFFGGENDQNETNQWGRVGQKKVRSKKAGKTITGPKQRPNAQISQ